MDALEHSRRAAGGGTSAKQFKSGQASKLAGILIMSRCLSESLANKDNKSEIDSLVGDLTTTEFVEKAWAYVLRQNSVDSRSQTAASRRIAWLRAQANPTTATQLETPSESGVSKGSAPRPFDAKAGDREVLKFGQLLAITHPALRMTNSVDEAVELSASSEAGGRRMLQSMREQGIEPGATSVVERTQDALNRGLSSEAALEGVLRSAGQADPVSFSSPSSSSSSFSSSAGHAASSSSSSSSADRASPPIPFSTMTPLGSLRKPSDDSVSSHSATPAPKRAHNASTVITEMLKRMFEACGEDMMIVHLASIIAQARDQGPAQCLIAAYSEPKTRLNDSRAHVLFNDALRKALE